MRGNKSLLAIQLTYKTPLFYCNHSNIYSFRGVVKIMKVFTKRVMMVKRFLMNVSITLATKSMFYITRIF